MGYATISTGKRQISERIMHGSGYWQRRARFCESEKTAPQRKLMDASPEHEDDNGNIQPFNEDGYFRLEMSIFCFHVSFRRVL